MIETFVVPPTVFKYEFITGKRWAQHIRFITAKYPSALL